MSRTVFLAWILREISECLELSLFHCLDLTHATASFRDSTSYGQLTAKQLRTQKASKALISSISASHYQHRPFVQVAVRWIINIFFFTIPWTYLAHVKTSSEFRGRLTNVADNWQRYIERLVREYSDFLLIVSLYACSLDSRGDGSPEICASPRYYFREPLIIGHVCISI